MWRPEGWNNPYYKKDTDGGFYNQYPKFNVFEAGADAIMEALFKLAKESPTGTFTIDSEIIQINEGG